MYQYNNSKTISKRAKKGLIIVASKGSDCIRPDKKKNNKKLENRNGKKNNCTDISSDKLVRVHTRRNENGYKKETSREKLNLF